MGFSIVRYFTFTFISLWFTAALLSPTIALAQIDLTFPNERMVFQRNNSNQATVQVAGSYSQVLDRVEVAVVNRINGVISSTTVLQNNPSSGQFAGALTMQGGWWKLIVKGIRNNAVVATDTLQRVGVGEVLAIMGHSNAQGSSCSVQACNYECNLCPTINGAADDRVNSVRLNQNNTADFFSPDFSQYENTADPRYLPGLTAFSKLDTYVGESSFARFAWFWGYLGDLLVQQLGVPVLFYNAGFGGSNMEHTYKSAYDIYFEHGFIRYDLRMPYVNTRNIMNLYVPSTGIRGFLLLHGENDRGNSTETIQMHNIGVIDKVRSEFNMPNLAWSMAISSYAVDHDWPNVRAAQENVINTPNYNVYRGPDVAQINSYDDRPDGIHFSPSGQQKVATSWFNALIGTNFFTSTTPYTAQTQPLTSLSCATGGQLTINQPTGYNRYLWDDGSATQSITVGPGTYSARIRNSQNQYFFPPAVTVPATVQPATPTITPTSATICSSQSVTLTSSNAVQNLWSTSATSQTIVASAAGTYSVQAVNPVYGCLSSPATATVTVSTSAGASVTISPTSSTITDGQSATLTASGCTGGQLRWSTSATTNTIVVSPSVTSGYSLTCTVPGGCSTVATATVVKSSTVVLPNSNLTLAMSVNNRTPAVGDTVTYTLGIRNNGPNSVTTVFFEDRLPPNLAFISGNLLTHTNGIVSGTLTNLLSGSSVTRSFRARINAAGFYINAAEIMTSTNADPTSQPGSGTGDGQDDAASVDFRTRDGGSTSVFVSPNPNQIPLPSVQSNQPAISPATADLSVRIWVSNRIATVGQTVSYTVTVYNDGGATATNVSVGNEFPVGLQFASSPNILLYQNGLLSASFSQIPAGQSASFSFTSTVTATGQLTHKVQIMAASPSDPDSTPGNGSFNGEDDTASADIRSY